MDTTTTYREAIGLWLDDPTVEQMLSETELADLIDQMALEDIRARAQIMLEDPTKPMERVVIEAQQRTIFDLFLVPILGVEPVETDPDTIPLLTPAQLLAQVMQEERDTAQPS